MPPDHWHTSKSGRFKPDMYSALQGLGRVAQQESQRKQQVQRLKGWYLMRKWLLCLGHSGEMRAKANWLTFWHSNTRWLPEHRYWPDSSSTIMHVCVLNSMHADPQRFVHTVRLSDLCRICWSRPMQSNCAILSHRTPSCMPCRMCHKRLQRLSVGQALVKHCKPIHILSLTSHLCIDCDKYYTFKSDRPCMTAVTILCTYHSASAVSTMSSSRDGVCQ